MSLSFVTYWYYKRVNSEKLGRSSKEDDASNENVKKSNRFIEQNVVTLQVQHTFLYISFLHNYAMKVSTFTFYGGREQSTTKFSFSF